MALEALKQVSEAESSAKESLQTASANSKKAIADAEAEGKRIYDARVAEAKKVNAEKLRDSDAQAEKNREDILHHAENQSAVLQAKAEGKLEEAADRIVERIVKR